MRCINAEWPNDQIPKVSFMHIQTCKRIESSGKMEDFAQGRDSKELRWFTATYCGHVWYDRLDATTPGSRWKLHRQSLCNPFFLRNSNFGRLMHHVTHVSTFKTTIASIRQASMNSKNRKHLLFFLKSKSHCPDTHSNTRPLFFPTLRCPLTTRQLHHW